MTAKQKITLAKFEKIYHNLTFKVHNSGTRLLIYYIYDTKDDKLLIPFKLSKSVSDLDNPVPLLQDINELIFRSGIYVGLRKRAKQIRGILGLDENNKPLKIHKHGSNSN